MKIMITALDFTVKVDGVVQTSIELACAYRAKIRFIHVMESLPASNAHRATELSYAREVHALKQDLLNKLEVYVAKARACDVEADCRLLFGSVEQAVIDASTEVGADLIVMGIHGHGAFHEVFGASVTKAVLKLARIPVYIVPCQANLSKGPDHPTRTSADIPVDRFLAL